jgi:sigma-B regulation protein RsbU (phosphoserine phosphatase)
VTNPWKKGVVDPVRLAAVEHSGFVGTGREEAFDRLLELAVELTGVPRACITLVDEEHTTAMSSIGFPEGSPLSAPVDQSFCRFVVGSGQPLIVDDARNDPRTCNDPAIESFGAATWAGYPIDDGDGIILGTLCLMDSQPHEWTPTDIHMLATLARAASSEIALRRSRADAAAAHQELVALRTAVLNERTALAVHLREVAGSHESVRPFAEAILGRLGESVIGGYT